MREDKKDRNTHKSSAPETGETIGDLNELSKKAFVKGAPKEGRVIEPLEKKQNGVLVDGA